MLELETQIVRATSADAQELSRLSAAIFPLGCPADTKPEDLAEYIERELTPERFRTLLAENRNVILAVRIAGRLAGYALIVHGATAPDARCSADCEIRKFYIDPAYHGRGVAHALMKEVVATAGAGRISALWLSVFSGNQRALAFYSRWGFRIVASHYFLVGTDHQKDYVMLRDTVTNAEDMSECK
jgi:ribosomal protein S18 acetylase RimI-like enzyme